MANSSETDRKVRRRIRAQAKRHGMTDEGWVTTKINRLAYESEDADLDSTDLILLESFGGRGRRSRVLEQCLVRADEDVEGIIENIKRDRVSRGQSYGEFVAYALDHPIGDTIVEDDIDPNMQVFTPEPVGIPRGRVTTVFYHPTSTIRWIPTKKA
jgi:hypothetical protein